MGYRRIPCIREPTALVAMFEAVSFRSPSHACETRTPCNSQSLGVQGRRAEGIFSFLVVDLDELFPEFDLEHLEMPYPGLHKLYCSMIGFIQLCFILALKLYEYDSYRGT